MKDYEEELKQIAKDGDVKSQLSLGWKYEHGQGVTQDYKTAVKWYRKAAEQGHAYAQYNLRLMYKQDRGVTKDDKAAGDS